MAAIYDGDTTAYQRRRIRDHLPPILLTNPDMLHLSILPYHGSWALFFKKLRFVVIDEIHTYRGIFGSHMAWVLRRLQRIARYYGADPQFALLSATIGNPGEFAERLIGRKVRVISVSGAAQAEKHFLFLNPWDSAATAASQLLEAAMKRGLRTIVYTKSRRMTELIHLWTTPRLGDLAAKLSSYRAGFLPEERREIEQKLSCGDLLAVVSTSALELGIDIGDLDLCILVGYPGSIMASWQRGGRVGRQFRKSAIIMIGQEDALDQHFMRQPEDFFSRPVESAVVNPENEAILQQHLHCAAAELPLSVAEPLLDNPAVAAAVETLSRSSTLLQDADGRSWYASRRFPQRQVNLRGGGVQLALIDCRSGEIFGEIDGGRALKECHPGAVYIHRANSWLIEDLDLQDREVTCAGGKPSYYTRPTSTKDTEILQTYDEKSVFRCRISCGRLRVTERVTGYQRLTNATQRVIANIPLELPEQIIETEGFWLEITEEIQKVSGGEAAALHGRHPCPRTRHDLALPAAGAVRPQRYRRHLLSPPSADRMGGDFCLRRACRRRRPGDRGLPPDRRTAQPDAQDDTGLSLRKRLPFLRPFAEMRLGEQADRQTGLSCSARGNSEGRGKGGGQEYGRGLCLLPGNSTIFLRLQ